MSTFSDAIERIRSGLEEKADVIFANAAPGVEPRSFTEALMQQIGATPKLAECSLASLAYTLRDSAELGLRIGSVLGFGYAVPRKGKAQFQVGYLGEQKLCYDSPLVAGVTTEVVRDGDDIQIVNGTDPDIVHKLNIKSRGNAIGYYAVIWLTSGKSIIRYMTRLDVEEHRNSYCPGWDKSGSAWLTAFDAMARKTCLSAAMKHAPLHNELAREVVQRAEVPDSEPESFPSGTEAVGNEMDAALSALNGDGPNFNEAPDLFNLED